MTAAPVDPPTGNCAADGAQALPPFVKERLLSVREVVPLTARLSDAYFDRMYSESADPWQLQDRWSSDISATPGLHYLGGYRDADVAVDMFDNASPASVAARTGVPGA